MGSCGLDSTITLEGREDAIPIVSLARVLMWIPSIPLVILKTVLAAAATAKTIAINCTDSQLMADFSFIGCLATKLQTLL